MRFATARRVLPLDAVFVQQEGDDAYVEDVVVVHVRAGAAGGDDNHFEEIPSA